MFENLDDTASTLSMDPDPNGPLSGIRVVEFTDEIGQFCGKLLAELGAEVIKVEPPGGSRVRGVGPFRRDRHDQNGSLTFCYYNSSKRSVVLDIERDADRVLELVGSADVVVETFAPGYLTQLGLGYTDVAHGRPDIIYCSITPFGQDGPWSHYEATDLVHLALGGVMASAGYDEADGAPPIAPTGGHSWHLASLYAANAIGVAIMHRQRGGVGQYIDVAVHDCVAVTTEHSFHQYTYHGSVVRRQTGRHAAPHPLPPGNFRTIDGRYINVVTVALDFQRWQSLVGLLQEFDPSEAEDLTDDSYLVPEILADRLPHVMEVLGRFIAKHTVEEIYPRAQERKLPFAPVRAVEDFQSDDHLNEDRKFFVEVAHPEWGTTYQYPGPPLKFSRTPFRLRRRAPLLGEDTGEVLEGILHDSKRPNRGSGKGVRDREHSALSGVVVLDFTWVVAGPQVTRLLGAWGAEVIKIEWPERLDFLRVHVDPPDGITLGEYTSAEGSGSFNDFNVNKKSVTLNMNDLRGREVFERLLERADVVVENFSPAAMEKWGYDYQALRTVNPRVVYLSLSGYGHTGRKRQYVTYGPSAQALGGLTFGAGLPDAEPAGWGFSYLDQVAGYIGAFGVTMALVERNRSGEGQHLDLAQSEAGLPLNGPAFLDYTVNGRPGRRSGFPPGNRSTWPGEPDSSGYRSEPEAVPHNAYRCAGGGHNDWCVIVARSNQEWDALCKVVGDPQLLRLAYQTLDGRVVHQEDIDAAISAWTSRFDKYDVMERLQAAGIACGAVQSAADRLDRDPQLAARDMYTMLDHPVLGPRAFQQVPPNMSATPPTLHQSAPLIGSANMDVYQRLAGLSRDQLLELADAGVLWPKDMDKPPWLLSDDLATLALDAE